MYSMVRKLVSVNSSIAVVFLALCSHANSQGQSGLKSAAQLPDQRSVFIPMRNGERRELKVGQKWEDVIAVGEYVDEMYDRTIGFPPWLTMSDALHPTSPFHAEAKAIHQAYESTMRVNMRPLQNPSAAQVLAKSKKGAFPVILEDIQKLPALARFDAICQKYNLLQSIDPLRFQMGKRDFSRWDVQLVKKLQSAQQRQIAERNDVRQSLEEVPSVETILIDFTKRSSQEEVELANMLIDQLDPDLQKTVLGYLSVSWIHASHPYVAKYLELEPKQIEKIEALRVEFYTRLVEVPNLESSDQRSAWYESRIVLDAKIADSIPMVSAVEFARVMEGSGLSRVDSYRRRFLALINPKLAELLVKEQEKRRAPPSIH